MMMRHMRLMMHQHMRMMAAMDDDGRMMIAVHAAPGRHLLILHRSLSTCGGLRGGDAQKAASGYDRECVSDFHDGSSTS
jgi:hypothetical protein